MSRQTDLERSIRESYSLIREYEDIIRLSDRPKEKLCAAGAWIGIENLPGRVHQFAVIDVEGDDPIVIVGSYNWTEAGVYDNDENTLILHDRELARKYDAEWQRLWATVPVERVCRAVRVFLPVMLQNHR